MYLLMVGKVYKLDAMAKEVEMLGAGEILNSIDRDGSKLDLI